MPRFVTVERAWRSVFFLWKGLGCVVGVGWVGWGGILTSWRPRPWFYVVNACSTNYEDLDDATWCYVNSTLGCGGVGWDINVLTTTSLILRCQRVFHQLGRRWWCNVMLGCQHGRTTRKRRFSGSGVAIRMWTKSSHRHTCARSWESFASAVLEGGKGRALLEVSNVAQRRFVWQVWRFVTS